MASQAFRLIYPQHLANEPVINHLLRQYTFTVNILRANITPEECWMDIHITGKAAEIEDAATWLKDQGIEVLPLSR